MKSVLGTVLLSLWSAGFALGGVEGARWMDERRAAQAAHAKDERKFEVKKPKPLTVPIVQGGKMQGYVVVQLAYGVDLKAAAAFGADPEPYLLDEAFAYLYADATFNPAQVESYDLDRLKSALEKRVAQRIKSDAVRDILVQEFNYVAIADLRR